MTKQEQGDFTVNEVSGKLIKRWEIKNQEKKPILLWMGGFQGAGKTSVIENLKNKINFIIISPDEIRHELFERKIKFGEEFVKMVDDIRNELIESGLKTNNHIIVDQRTTEERVDLAKILIKNSNYILKTVYLEAPFGILKERVSRRSQIKGLYKGTVEELETLWKIDGNKNIDFHDLIIDTNKNSIEEVANQIKIKIFDN
jgi:adenylylsulfate kinase-like enzyme